MKHSDPLLDRCIDIYEAAFDMADGMQDVFRLIAADILEHHHRASAREVAQMLIEAAAPDHDDEPAETWDSHPSLTAEQRNPNLR